MSVVNRIINASVRHTIRAGVNTAKESAITIHDNIENRAGIRAVLGREIKKSGARARKIVDLEDEKLTLFKENLTHKSNKEKYKNALRAIIVEAEAMNRTMTYLNKKLGENNKKEDVSKIKNEEKEKIDKDSDWIEKKVDEISDIFSIEKTQKISQNKP